MPNSTQSLRVPPVILKKTGSQIKTVQIAQGIPQTNVSPNQPLKSTPANKSFIDLTDEEDGSKTKILNGQPPALVALPGKTLNKMTYVINSSGNKQLVVQNSSQTGINRLTFQKVPGSGNNYGNYTKLYSINFIIYNFSFYSSQASSDTATATSEFSSTDQ